MTRRRLSVVVGLLLANAVAADGTATAAALTEPEALRQAVNRPSVVDLREGRTGVAEADAVAAGLWPNPSLAYQRESVQGDPAETDEDFAWISQRFDLSGRRGLRREAAELRIDSARREVDAWVLDLEMETRRRFYATLLAQGRREAASRWVQRMRTAATTVRRREAAGDASAYDRRRLDREVATARARLRTEEARHERARARLGAVLGSKSGEDLVVSGVLLPPVAPSVETLLEDLPGRADLQGLENQALAAEREQSAAERWWIPQVAVGGGVKTVESQTGRSTGYLLNFVVPVPVFDRDQDDAQRAASEAQTARAERQLALAEAKGRLRGLWSAQETLTTASREFRRDAADPSEDLVRTATTAYANGESDILELLDAYRSAFEAEIDLLDLEHRAREAAIDLERAVGGYSR